MLPLELMQKKEYIFGKKTTDFFFLFHTLSRGYHCCIAKLSKEIGLYRGQAPLLLLLSRKDHQTQRELCKSLGIKAASATDALQRMEKSELVMRQRDEKDLRTMRVSITQKGREKAELFLEKEQNLDEIFFRNFSEKEKEDFLYAFARITGNLIDEINGWNENEGKNKRTQCGEANEWEARL